MRTGYQTGGSAALASAALADAGESAPLAVTLVEAVSQASAALGRLRAARLSICGPVAMESGSVGGHEPNAASVVSNLNAIIADIDREVSIVQAAVGCFEPVSNIPSR